MKESEQKTIGNGYFYRTRGGMMFVGIPDGDPVWSHDQRWFVTGRKVQRSAIKTKGVAMAAGSVVSSAGHLMFALVSRGLLQTASTNQRGGRRYMAAEIKQVDNQPTIIRTNPMRPRSVESDVLVPVQQAAITGLAAAAVAVVITFGIDRYIMVKADIVPDGYLYIGGLVGLIFSARAWFVKFPHLDDVIYNLEELTGVDINKDSRIGDPGIAPRRIPLNTSHGQSHIEAPHPTQKAHAIKWQRLAYLHLHCGVKLSRREIVSASKNRDGVALSQNDYSTMLKALQDANMMKNENLNDAGRHFLIQRLPDGIGG